MQKFVVIVVAKGVLIMANVPQLGNIQKLTKKQQFINIFNEEIIRRSQGAFDSNRAFRSHVIQRGMNEIDDGITLSSASTMYNEAKLMIEAMDPNIGLGRDPKKTPEPKAKKASAPAATTEPDPAPAATTDPVVEAAPVVVADAEPPVVETDPVVTTTDPVVEAAPVVVADAEPVVETDPVVTTTEPVVETDPVVIATDAEPETPAEVEPKVEDKKKKKVANK